MSDIDSIEVEASAKLVTEIRRLIISYMSIFAHAPSGVAVSAHDWLKVIATLMLSYRATFDDASNEMSIDGVAIFCKLNGPPEILANPEDAKYCAWMKLQDDKRLWPILTGA